MIVLLCLLSAGLGALAGGLWFRRREKRTLEALDWMLDRAAQGAAIQGPLDEGLLSAVETRLGEYLESVGTASQALQEEKDRIKTLVSDIAHQTRTPVANLLLYTQLLGEEDLSGQGKVCVQALEAQAEKLRTLMEASVKTSRLETGMLALCPTPNPVGPMLEEAVAQFAPGAAEKGLTLTLVPTGAAARFDPKWTGEAVCNLLDNGVKVHPRRGENHRLRHPLRTLLPHRRGRHRPGPGGGGAGQGVPAVLPVPGGPGPGGGGHRPVPGAADRRRPGRICAGGFRPGGGEYLLSLFTPVEGGARPAALGGPSLLSAGGSVGTSAG